MKFTRRSAIIMITFAGFLWGRPVAARDNMKVVASFSILADFVKNVGGDRVTIASLIGPNGDAHVFSPSPADARILAEAKVVFVNGLGLEGWMTRLVKASGSTAPMIVASKGIKPLKLEERAHHHDHAEIDPHAWQSIANAKIYVSNIRDGLIAADPAGRNDYEANVRAYLAKLDALEAEVRAAIDKIPSDRRKIITSHDAFGYFGAAYGLQFIAPQGVSTNSEASAKDVAKIIRQIKAQKIPAVFMENISNERLIRQIVRETGAKVGGTLYSDALSDATGPASTYIDMIRNNIREFGFALSS